MQLVHFLVSGVNGAANGTATFLLRGTASSAASVLYNDFEGTAQPGTNIITLDANGSAEVYTNAYCDVVIKNSGGTTLRTVTVGGSATNIEVISDSFTGTSYSGSPTATSQPITLTAVLDKWDNSAGADDWKVLVNGVATNLSSAFASIAGLFFNVKDSAYGAVGDGVTNDTTAINLAITAAAAAGGGIVFFPATTSFYSVTALPITAANITLMGAGPKASVIKFSTTTDAAISFTDNTSGAWKRIINLGIQGTAANSNALFQYENSQNIYIQNVDFNCSTYTGSAIRRSSTSGFTFAVFNGCTLTLGSSVQHGFINAANDAQSTIKITDCLITVPASFTGFTVVGPDFIMSGSTVDGSAVTSGSWTCVDPSSNEAVGRFKGRFVNNVFIDGGSSGRVFYLQAIATNSNFHEDCNSFVGFTSPSALSSSDLIYDVTHSAADGYKVTLGSRRGRTLEITHNSTGTLFPLAAASYECIFVNYTGAGNLTIQAPIAKMTNGSRIMFVLLNNSGAQRDIVIDYGESLQTYGSTVDVTLQPNDGERCVFIMEFMHFGSGAPLCFITGAVED
jgi:hypothetical protein